MTIDPVLGRYYTEMQMRGGARKDAAFFMFRAGPIGYHDDQFTMPMTKEHAHGDR